MAISFVPVGTFSGVQGGPSVITNPTSLQFGPDGRLYVAEQNGDINAFTVSLSNGQYVATAHELLTLPGGGGVVKSIQNHNDDGSDSSQSNRQVTGILVTGTAENPVLYISSSDPRIASNNDVNLDTNSGVITRVTWTGSAWEAVDIVRGLPRSEENHSNNGLAINPLDPTKLYVMVGGNTNNGAPSQFFAYTGEYALSGTLLEIDLTDIESRPILTDPNGGQNGASRQYIYDLPTLDDPNTPNAPDGLTDAEALAQGFRENSDGMDIDGPWGGRDGLNMAVLPADAPLRIYADGFRNAYDIAFTADGRLYTVDNGSNGNLGGNPNTETGDLDGDGVSGEAINTPNNGGTGAAEPLFLIEEGGYYGHPAPIRANQNQSWTSYNNSGTPDTSLTQNTVADISAQVPDGVAIPAGFVVDPSKYAVGPGQSMADLSGQALTDALFARGVRIPYTSPESPAIVTVGSSTNGIVVYDSQGQAFDGVLDGKLFVTQFNDNVTLLNLNEAGDGLAPVPTEGPDGVFGTADDGVQDADGVFFVANNSLGVPLANPLDVTMGPNGTLWVAEIGSNEITVLAPSDIILPGDNDSDDDGILNAVDPFLRDATNGTSVIVAPGAPTVWEFSQGAGDTTPGPDGFGGGLTGHMIDGITDFEAFLQSESTRPGQQIQLDNVKFVTAAAGGTTTIEEVSEGDPFLGANTGQFLFHTGFVLAPNVETFTVTWVVKNPGAVGGGSDITNNFQQIGGYLGDGTQSNYLKIVAIATDNPSGGAAPAANIQIALENNDTVPQTINLPANGIFDNANLAPDSNIVFELTVDLTTNLVTPKATYTTITGDVEVTGTQTIDLTGSNVLDAILGNNTVQGQQMGLAAGLFSSNTQSPGDTFQAVFDSITVSATEAQVPPGAVDDEAQTGVDTVLEIPVATLLANDTDANPGDALTVTGVSNPQNGTVSLANGVVTFTPTPGFEGAASFDYTITDGTFTDTATVAVTVADEVILYRVNAGGNVAGAGAGTIAAIDGGPDWVDDSTLINGTGPVSLTGATANTFSNALTDAQDEVDFLAGPNAADAAVAPWQLFVNERSDNTNDATKLTYNFDVTPGATYKITLFYTENWNNVFGFASGTTGGKPAGQSRQFDVEVEGVVPTEFDDINPLAESAALIGGVPPTANSAPDSEKQPFLGVALQREAIVTAGDDTLTIAFNHGFENPKINAIQIAQVGGTVAPPAPVLNILATTQTVTEGETAFISIATDITVPNDEEVTFTYVIEGVTATPEIDYSPDDSLTGAGTATFTGTATITGGSADFQIPVNTLPDELVEGAETFTVTITSVSPNATLGPNSLATVTIADDDFAPGTVLFRVNAGGPEIAAADGGPAWAADTAAANNPNLVSAGSNDTNGFAVVPGAGVPATVPAALFLTERWDQPTDPSMQWAFAVADGSYIVNLFMGNGFAGTSASGQRVFDVAIEGVVPANLDDVDLSGQLGHLSGGVFTTTVEVTDGQLNIEFIHGVENPLINAIEIIAADDPTPPYEPPLDNLFGAAVEISDDRLAPSDGGVLADGDNVVIATQEGESGENDFRDRDYFTFTVPEGKVLTGIFLDGFTNANPNAPDGFLAIQLGDRITVDPITGQPDAGTGPLLGALIYGSGTSATQNLIETMAAGGTVDPSTGFSLPGFDPSVLTGEISVWLNQGAGPGTPQLRFVVGDAAPAPVTLSIADAPTLVENGDTAPTTLAFPITATDPAFSGPVTITYDQGTQTGLTQEVVFTDGAGTLSIDVPSDDVDDGDDPVSVTLTGADGGGGVVFVIDPAADTAAGLVTEDDGGAPVGVGPTDDLDGDGVLNQDDEDLDGDGIANAADPFAYDGENGGGRQLLQPGDAFRQDFDVDTANPFDPAAGFTGIITNPGFNPPGASGADPYGVSTTEATSFVEDGSLKVTSFFNDKFGASGTGANNTIRDNYQSAVDVSGVDKFSIEAKAANPFPETTSGNGQQFKSFGITLGAGGVNDYVKWVFGIQDATGARVELAHENSLVGGNNSQPLQSAPIGITELVSDVIFRIDIDKSADVVSEISAGTLQAFVTFLDADGEEIGSYASPLRQIAPGGSLAAALANENPLTGGVGGLAYGISITDFNSGAASDVNRFEGSWDYIEIRAANEAPTIDAIDAGGVVESADPVSIDLLQGAADADGGTLAVRAESVFVTDGSGAAVQFTLDGTSLSIDPAQFAAVLDAGQTETVTVSYTIVDGQGGETPNTATLVVNGEAGPFVWYLDGDQDGFGVDDPATNLSQTADPGAGYSQIAGDADDADATVFPGAPEINDGKDNDQDGETDEDNQAPVPDAEAFTVTAGSVLTIPVADLLDGDTDPDAGDVLNVVAVGEAVGGTVTLDAQAGTVTFTPDAGFTGEASFTYTVSDDVAANPLTANQTVNVTVEAFVNTPPTTAPIDAGQVAETADPVIIDLLEGAADSDGGQLGIGETITVQDADGNDVAFTRDGTSLSIDPGQFAAALDAGESAEITVSFTITDGQGGETSNTATLTVTGADDAPPLPANVRIQAEDFDTATTYATQALGVADGDQVIALPLGASGSASYNLAARGVAPGVYTVAIGHFDENDGDSTLGLTITSDATPTFATSFLLDDDATSGNAAQRSSFRTKIFTNVTIGANGTLTLSGTSDGEEFVRIDYIDFIATGGGTPGNTAPFAPFDLPGQTVAVNAPFSFDAGALFADGQEDELSFTATSDLPGGALPAGVSFDPATGVFGGTPTQAGTFEITVTANDGALDSPPETFTLTVEGVNEAPVLAAAIPDQILTPGEAVDLDVTGSFSDPDGDALGFALTGTLPDGVTFSNGVFSGTPSATAAAGSYQVTVTATDPSGADVSDTFLLNVLGSDDRETVRIEAESGALAPGGFFVEAGSRIRLLANDEGQATYDLTGVAPGDYLVRIGYFDENDGISRIDVAVNSDGNSFTAGFDLDDDAGSGNAAQMQNFRVKTLDGTLTLGAGGQLVLTGAADAEEFVRVDYIELVPVGGEANFAPTETAGGVPDQTIVGLVPVAIDAAAGFADPEEDPLTYAIVEGPSWLTIDPVTGALTGTPDVGGVYDVVVSATDVANNPTAPATSSFTIAVEVPENAPPVPDFPVGPLTVAQGGLLEEAITFSDPEGGPVSYALADGAPDWLSIDSFGTLSGQPGAGDVAGNLAVEVIATDAQGATASLVLDVTVTNVNDAPALGTPLADQSAVVGTAFAYALPAGAFTDADDYLGDTLTYSATLADGSPLPAWLTIDPATGALSGTPDSDTDLAVAITASDGELSVTAPPLAITVTSVAVPADPVTIEAEDFTGLPDATGFVVNNLASASGNQIIRLPADTTGVVTTDLSAFAGGIYKVAVTYIDETDGVSTAQVLVDGVPLGSWAFDGASGSQLVPGGLTGNLAQPGNYRVIEFDAPFAVADGSVLTLQVTSASGEFGRVDSITLIPAAFPAENQPPTVTLVPVLTTVAEDADTTEALKVADIAVADDGLGTNVLGLAGADADAFEIVGTELFLKAGTALDFETKTVFDVSVTVDDATVGATPDASTSFTLAVTDVDDLPTVSVGVGSSTTEGDPAAATLTLSESLGQPVTVTLTLTPGTGGAPATVGALAAGGDVAFDAAGTISVDVTIPAGQTSVEVPLSIFADAEVEPFETFEIAITAANLGLEIDAGAPAVPVDATPAVGGILDATLPPFGETVVLRINAFGPEVAAIDGGPVWQGDGLGAANNPYLSTTDDRGDAFDGYDGDPALIPAGVPEAVLDTARSSDGPFSYDIPVGDIGGPGTFRVTLYIAELFAGGQAGNFRIFDASLEGAVPVAFDNIDPGTDFGPGGALGVLSAEVSVDAADGVLNIGFLQNSPATQNPIVNAIEVVRLGAPVTDTEGPTASIALINPADANAPLLVEVTLDDATGVDPATLGADDLLVPSGGAVTFLGFDAGVATYEVAAPVGGWQDGAVVAVTLQAGAVEDTLDNANLAETGSITLDIDNVGATDGQALFTANVSGGSVTGASTFGANALQITNLSANGVSITQVVIDLTDTMIPDTAFDTRPAAQGGPIGDATNKPFTLDGATIGLAASNVTVTMNGAVQDPQRLGFGDNQLILDFEPGTFAPGDLLSFSIDIDPFTATVGAIGGAVAGFEIAGGTVTVAFDDGSSATSVIAPVDNTVTGRALVQAGQPNLGAPTLTLGDGSTDPRVVNQADLPITIDAGAANANGTARVFILDTAFVSNAESPSIDPPDGPDAIRGNNAQDVANVIEVQLDGNGIFNGTIPLTRSTTQQANANGNLGFNYFAAGVVDTNGEVTQFSNTLVVEFDPAANVPPVGGGGGVPTGDVLLRINAFGPELVATDGGPNWLGDTAASPSPFYASTQNRGDTDGTPAAPDLPNVPNAIFTTARSDDAPFSYNIPVSALDGVETGDVVTVNLYFAEAFDGNNVAGERIFDVTMEGALAIDNLDVAAQFSGGGGVISTVVRIVGDALNLSFVNGGIDNAIVSGIEIVAGGSNPINGGASGPADPTDVLEILGVADGDFDGIVQGVAVDSFNDGGLIGSVVLTVIDGNDTVDASNFGANSFQLTNTGTKEIAAVFIDIRSAVFGDQVFDIDGTGGDTASATFGVDTETGNGTGAFFVGADGVPGNNADNLFFPGPTPLADTSGLGSSNISGGYRGLLIRFDGSDGGFGGGETVGFSGDGDPNSIAGFGSGQLNGFNVTSSSFDTGGQSGAELVGSSFTVLFADGTTATGYLGSDTTQAGAAGEAVQGRAERTATLSVDTGAGIFASGQAGTYGGSVPVITVSGNPGDVVRVMLHKGFQPTDNTAGSPDSIAEVIQARLDAGQPDFPVNNAFDVQTVDVTIGAGGTVVVPAGAFDFVETDSGESFPGDAVQPIALTAAVVEQVTDTGAIVGSGAADLVPVGPVSQPIYLTNQGGPVSGGPVDPPVEPIEGYFAGIDTGAGYRFKVQIEDPNANGGQDPGGLWNFFDAPDSEGRQTGFQGDGYYLFGSNTSNAIVGAQAQNELVYTILIPDDQVGTFAFRARFSRDGLSASDQQNDLWLNFRKAGSSESIEDYLILGNSEPEPISNGAIKIFGGPNNGTWGSATAWDGVPNNPATQLAITEGGLYEVVIIGRSQGLHVDYWELFRDVSPGTSASNSPFVVIDPNAPAAPVIAGGTTASVQEGAIVALDVDANDANGDALTFSISGGADQSLFSINSVTGVVTFNAAPDFEIPADADGNNVYNIQVTVSDGALTDSANYAITVTDDPSDNPVAAGPLLTFQVFNGGTLIDDDLENGDSLNELALGDTPLFSGTLEQGDAGSVFLELLDAGGNLLDTQTENNSPFDLTYNGPAIGDGSYTLRATFFAADNLAGGILGTQEIDFEVGGAVSVPTDFRIEAETLTLESGFGVFSEGSFTLIRLPANNPNNIGGVASTTLTDVAPGFYSVQVLAYNENDGEGQFQVTVGDDVFDFVTLDASIGGNVSDGGQVGNRVLIDLGVIEVDEGDEFELVYNPVGNEIGRFDYIDFIAVDDPAQV